MGSRHEPASYRRSLASASSDHTDFKLIGKVWTSLNGAALFWVRSSTNWKSGEGLLTDRYWVELQHGTMKLLKTRSSNLTWPPTASE